MTFVLSALARSPVVLRDEPVAVAPPAPLVGFAVDRPDVVELAERAEPAELAELRDAGARVEVRAWAGRRGVLFFVRPQVAMGHHGTKGVRDDSRIAGQAGVDDAGADAFGEGVVEAGTVSEESSGSTSCTVPSGPRVTSS